MCFASGTINRSADFAEANVFQLNDTHPSIAVAEMMRILLDDPTSVWNGTMPGISPGAMAYTNHTLLPEALERWPVRLFPSCCRGCSRSSMRSMHGSCADVANAGPATTTACVACH